MKQKNIITENKDLEIFINEIWINKILIVFLGLLFMVAGYIFGSLAPKIYKTEIILRNPELILGQVNDHSSELLTTSKDNLKLLENIYFDEFKIKLISRSSLIEFIEKNEVSKKYAEKNIDVKKIFSQNIDKINNLEDFNNKNNKNNIYKFSITYSQPLLGKELLNDYVKFTIKNADEIYNQEYKKILLKQINYFDQNLEIARKIDLHNPLIKSTVESNNVLTEPSALFYKGTKVLTQQLYYLNKMLSEIRSIGYNMIIVEKASDPIIISKNPNSIAAIAFILGLCFSILIIFLRLMFNK